MSAAPITPADAVGNAVRILANAEGETNLPQADSLTRIAEIWVPIANHLHEVG